MITTCKQCDSGGRANERARTGIESERARAVFQNIHSHTGQWTFGCILSGVGEGGSARNAWDLRKEFSGAWEWQCHGSRQRTLLKRRHNRRACLKTPSLLHRLGFSSFYDLFFKDWKAVFSRTSPNKRVKSVFTAASFLASSGDAQQSAAAKRRAGL